MKEGGFYNEKKLNVIRRLYNSLIYICPISLIRTENDLEMLSRQHIGYHFLIKIILFYYTICAIKNFVRFRSNKNMLLIFVNIFFEMIVSILIYLFIIVMIIPGFLILGTLFVISTILIIFIVMLLLIILTIPQIIYSSFIYCIFRDNCESEEAIKFLDNIYLEINKKHNYKSDLDPLQDRINNKTADDIFYSILCVLFSSAFVTIFLYLSIFTFYI